MQSMEQIYKTIAITFGGVFGWVVGELRPAFPLMIVALIFVVADAYTAYRLCKRAERRYPEMFADKAKFNSHQFSHVITDTIPMRILVVLLAFIVDRWVFPMYSWHLVNFATGAIAFEQFWSMCENESSCREESEGRFWKMMQKIMVDKTGRHLNTDLSNYNERRNNNGRH